MSKICVICNRPITHLKKHYKKEHPHEFFERFLNNDIKNYKNQIQKLKAEDQFEESFYLFWNGKFAEEMSTSEMIDKLRSMNIYFETEDFKQKARNYISSEKLADECYYTQNYKADRYEEDFIWMAITELWKRLIPDKINTEQIDNFMQDGYEYLDRRDYSNMTKFWEKSWDMIRSIVPSHIKSVEEADEFLSPMS